MKRDIPICKHEKLEYRPCCDSVICLQCKRKWEKPWVTVSTTTGNYTDGSATFSKG